MALPQQQANTPKLQHHMLRENQPDVWMHALEDAHNLSHGILGRSRQLFADGEKLALELAAESCQQGRRAREALPCRIGKHGAPGAWFIVQDAAVRRVKIAAAVLTTAAAVTVATPVQWLAEDCPGHVSF